ncbi:MMPL family transporter [Methylococcus capsulatus]|uniref:MMPL family transporter n=1 Tax=Methylococcus capsulatus TaxID=414 RepID=UPI001C533D9A|nr:MMPL family transporter [Methylococcus capsulatus]QXP88417.1 MMPL family transporter [Methylococcus capsulatus]QXP94566.1 MMPL family transporter [Methylococcus capsulatus]UQN13460.1 MMPL family transporter [Methylococcus capsulatus]
MSKGKKTATQEARTSFLIRLMHGWESRVLTHPWLVLFVALAACGVTLQYTMKYLTVNTNTADTLSTELPFQKNRIRFETEFPQDVSTVVLLVEGKTPEQASDAVDALQQKLAGQPATIESIYVPDGGDFFARNGLLYLNLEDLEKVSRDLSAAQPFFGRLAEDNSLDGFFGIYAQALDAKESDLPVELGAFTRRLDEAFRAALEQRPYRLSWQQLIMGQKEGLGITKRFIVIRPKLFFEELMPAAKAMATIDRAIDDIRADTLSDVQVRKTGEVVLEYEEMLTVQESVTVAGLVSTVLVCLTLWLAYRSFRLMFATFLTLGMGLVFSMGFATLAIGQLNLISISFTVLFIGMGDAYSSHFCLRYRELILRGMPQRAALRETFASTGSALLLCTLTAAIGLYAFIPTAYSGVAELGIIAGTSMFIALATTFTVLPAIMNILPYKPSRRAVQHRPRALTRALLSNWPMRYAGPIRILTLILGVAAAALLSRIMIDFNPINLRDPSTESVKTFKYLLKSRDTSPMTLASLASNEEDAHARIRRFEELASVDSVRSIFDFVPDRQDEKLAAIADLALVLGPQLQNFPAASEAKPNLQTLEKLHAALRKRLEKSHDPDVAALDGSLERLLEQLRASPPQAVQDRLDALEKSVLGGLRKTITHLSTSLEAEPITLDSLPADIRERWISKDGLYRLQIFPRYDLNDLDKLREFIQQAQTVDPDVTDLPVTYLESMNAVIVAFAQAFGTALGAITLLLLLILRNLKDTLLVLLPLLLASLFTAAVTVLIHVPFNFANIIALPLLFGLGVDNGIHMAHRLHYLKSTHDALLDSSEAKGVFYGALTTVFSFASLAFTPHPGMSSMGILLAIGLMLSLVCALIVLPAFAARRVKV